MQPHPCRVMLCYWGRRGALTQFTLEAGRAARVDANIRATISVSRQNEAFPAFEEFGDTLFPINTFKSNLGVASQASRIPLIRRALFQRLQSDRIEVLIELMPHVWSPFIMSVSHRAGVRYATIIHDADPHPGDYTSVVKGFLDWSIRSADVVFTLSRAVAEPLLAAGVPQSKVFTLFHPDLRYGKVEHARIPNAPLRLLFLGRIMPYKGLPLFLDAVELLRQQGIPVAIGVFGEGSLGSSAQRLARLGAEVVNRWLADDEIAKVLSRFDALVCSHIEASQSGVVATAHGAGLPVVATPVGGLIEQIHDGITGVIAVRPDGPALAEAIKRLLNIRFYQTICDGIQETVADRSMSRFLEEIVSKALGTERRSQ